MLTIDGLIEKLQRIKEERPDAGSYPVVITDPHCPRETWQNADVDVESAIVLTVSSSNGLPVQWRSSISEESVNVLRIY